MRIAFKITARLRSPSLRARRPCPLRLACAPHAARAPISHPRHASILPASRPPAAPCLPRTQAGRLATTSSRSCARRPSRSPLTPHTCFACPHTARPAFSRTHRVPATAPFTSPTVVWRLHRRPRASAGWPYRTHVGPRSSASLSSSSLRGPQPCAPRATAFLGEGIVLAPVVVSARSSSPHARRAPHAFSLRPRRVRALHWLSRKGRPWVCPRELVVLVHPVPPHFSRERRPPLSCLATLFSGGRRRSRARRCPHVQRTAYPVLHDATSALHVVLAPMWSRARHFCVHRFRPRGPCGDSLGPFLPWMPSSFNPSFSVRAHLCHSHYRT
ncbi:hypothetical protein B0H11DRAFT_2252915 [Mycena galericulata]|nr:hypothetical protein B0H11DRAFT_2252915 [Mycena galericulata]